jgi:hypothetical protein
MSGQGAMQSTPISQTEIDARIGGHVDELLELWWAEQGASKPNDTALLGAPDTARIGESMSVDGWVRLLARGGFGPVDVLLRDADQVVLAALKPEVS